MTKSHDRSVGNLGRRKSLRSAITIIVVCFAAGIAYWVWAGKREADTRMRQLEQARLESEKLITSVEEAKRRNMELQGRLKAEEDAREAAQKVRMEAENARAAKDLTVAAQPQASTEAKSRAAVLSRASEKEASRPRERERKAKEDAYLKAARVRMEAEYSLAAQDARAKDEARREAERIQMADARAAEDARVAAKAHATTEANSRAAAQALEEEARDRGRREYAALGPAVQLEPQRSIGRSSSEASPDRTSASPRRQRRTTQQLCASSSNLVTRTICEAYWCATPEHSEEGFCKQARLAQAGEPRREAGY